MLLREALGWSSRVSCAVLSAAMDDLVTPQNKTHPIKAWQVLLHGHKHAERVCWDDGKRGQRGKTVCRLVHEPQVVCAAAQRERIQSHIPLIVGVGVLLQWPAEQGLRAGSRVQEGAGGCSGGGSGVAVCPPRPTPRHFAATHLCRLQLCLGGWH